MNPRDKIINQVDNQIAKKFDYVLEHLVVNEIIKLQDKDDADEVIEHIEKLEEIQGEIEEKTQEQVRDIICNHLLI